MGTPFMGEIKLISFTFAPKGWALCNGQFLAINQNQALFSLFGTTYGGDGRVTFALPDLRSRAPIHQFGGHNMGERAGQEFHTLIQSEMPQHFHVLQAVEEDADAAVPDNGKLLAGSAPNDFYTGFAGPVAISPATISTVGGSQPHENRQPFLVINYMVALQGLFPSQN